MMLIDLLRTDSFSLKYRAQLQATRVRLAKYRATPEAKELIHAAQRRYQSSERGRSVRSARQRELPRRVPSLEQREKKNERSRAYATEKYRSDPVHREKVLKATAARREALKGTPRTAEQIQRRKESANAYARRKYAALTGAEREQRRQRMREWGRNRSKEVRERWNAYSRGWNAKAYTSPEVKEKHAARAALRNGLLKQAGTLTKKEWALLQKFYGCCAYCGATDKKLTTDHVTPLSRGGAHSTENVVPACGSCNSRKGKRTLSEAAPLMGLDLKKFSERHASVVEKIKKAML